VSTGPIPIGSEKSLDTLKDNVVKILKDILPSYSQAIDLFAP